MTNEEKYKYAFALTSVASAGLSFVEDSLLNMMDDKTDLTRLRSFYMLLSYNFELILKSRVIMTGSFTDKPSLNAQLVNLGHDIQDLASTLGKTQLEAIGISKVQKNIQYKVSATDNKEVLIEDFTKIRYDFLDNIVRSVDSQEHTRIKEYADTLFFILRKAKEKNEEDKNQSS